MIEVALVGQVQTPVQATDYLVLAQWISAVLLPLLGVVLIVFCMLSFVRPWGANFRDRIQKIKGLGLELQVSVVTVFVLIGIALASAGLYLIVLGYDTQRRELAELKARFGSAEESFNKALALAQKINIEAQFTFDDLGNGPMPDLSALDCGYNFFAEARTPARAFPGVQPNQVRIRFEDVTRAKPVEYLVCTDRNSPRRWDAKVVKPLEPEFRLSLVKTN